MSGALTRDQRRIAYDAFLQALDRETLELGEARSFDVCPLIECVEWRVGPVASMMVRSELSAVIHSVNQWRVSLKRWSAWQSVIDRYDQSMAWHLRSEFASPLSFFCMFQPASIRDMFCLVATNSLHQVRLSVDEKCKDVLWSDNSKSRQSRPTKEEKLAEMIGNLKGNPSFTEGLTRIDDQPYRKLTRNFRNKASHDIPPMFDLGHSMSVTRQVKSNPDVASEMNQLGSDRTRVYSVSPSAPLISREMIAANLEQHEAAEIACSAYVALLDGLLAKMPHKVRRR